MSTYWQVALPSPPFSILTYELPSAFPEVERGMRVVVPVRGGLRAALCTVTCDKPEFATKPMVWPLESSALLDSSWLAMAEHLAARQMAPLGRVLSVLLPSGLRTTGVTYALKEKGLPGVLSGTMSIKDIRALEGDALAAFLAAWNAGNVAVRLNPRKEADARVASLAGDPPWAVRPGALRQQAVLEYLYEHGPTMLGMLTSALGSGTKGIADTLARNGLLLWDAEPAVRLEDEEQLSLEHESTPQQQKAIAALSASMRRWAGNTGLVHGVTGSGKTHVYLALVRQALESGRSCLLLAPEVALATALYRTVRACFGEDRARLYHGYQSPGVRQRTFSEAGRAEGPLVVVGTRSALFLPFRKLGLVVIDEEHDESFKQEERLAYQAKEVAWTRVRECRGMLVLGSATPDLKTYYAARSGQVPLMTMSERVGTAALPEVMLEDISGMKSQEAPLAPAVEARLLETVEAGQQAIIMLNRRGYSPVMYCLDCGEAAKCPACDVGLTYHKGRQRLVCHYCGLTVPYPALCTGCGGTRHLPMGGGTERMEEYLRTALPEGVNTLRLDRDSARRQERLEHILESFAAGQAQVLVGTQMLSKGHHFPSVTLVVVADGDLGLNLPDYRSAERTFQLLVQVSGRAGRGERPGQVIIQTRNPGHPLWTDVLSADYGSFYQREIGKREKFGYPPFACLALIRLSHGVDDEAGAGYVSGAAGVLRDAAATLGVSVLGPAPAPLSRLNNRRRYNCLLKGQDWPSIRGVFSRLARWNPAPGALRIGLDIDPVNML